MTSHCLLVLLLWFLVCICVLCWYICNMCNIVSGYQWGDLPPRRHLTIFCFECHSMGRKSYRRVIDVEWVELTEGPVSMTPTTVNSVNLRILQCTKERRKTLKLWVLFSEHWERMRQPLYLWPNCRIKVNIWYIILSRAAWEQNSGKSMSLRVILENLQSINSTRVTLTCKHAVISNMIKLCSDFDDTVETGKVWKFQKEEFYLLSQVTK